MPRDPSDESSQRSRSSKKVKEITHYVIVLNLFYIINCDNTIERTQKHEPIRLPVKIQKILNVQLFCENW